MTPMNEVAQILARRAALEVSDDDDDDDDDGKEDGMYIFTLFLSTRSHVRCVGIVY